MLQDILPFNAASSYTGARLRIIDSTDGTPETGVVYNTTGIDLWYCRQGGARVAITEATLAAVDSAYSSGGVIHISTGYYRLDLPDAALATGATFVDFGGTVTGMVVIGGRIKLTAGFSFADAVRAGLTALPNAAAEAAGGLYTRGTGAGQIAQDANGNVRTNLDTIKTQAVTCGAGVTVRADVGAAAAPGVANGMFIGGTNAATTVASLAVTGAVTAASATMSGALQAATIVSTGTTTLNALAVTNNASVGGTTTHTGAVSHGNTTTYTGAVTYSGAITATAGAVSMTNASNDIKGVFSATNGIVAASIATGAITNAKFAAGAIDAAAIADAAIDNATFAADVGSTALATNMVAKAAEKAVGVAGVSLTNTGIPAATVTALGTGSGLTALATAAELAKVPKSDSNVSWNSTALAAINAEVDTALNTAIPGSPTADSINERIVAIDANADSSGVTELLTRVADAPAGAAPTLALTTNTVHADAGNTASSFRTHLTEADDYWNDALILITSGALAGQVKEIGDFANTNGVITLTSGQAFTGIPADNVTFAIINR